MNNKIITILFLATYKIVVKVCQSWANEYTGQVLESSTPQLNKGDFITFGNKMIVKG